MNVPIPYTLCFCRAGDNMLMLLRNRPPNKDLWNGIGGKIEEGEDVEAALRREVLEEANIDIALAKSVLYGGIVTWTSVNDIENRNKGMYVYIVDVAESEIFQEKEITEGTLSWKPVDWVCNTQNTKVVGNIPIFLPPMLSGAEAQRYHFMYDESVLKEVRISGLELALAEKIG